MTDADGRRDPARLIDDYGRFAGFPDLAFDEEGLLGLRFDDVDLTLSTGGTPGALVVQSALDLSKIAVDNGFVVSLHAANAVALRNGIGAVTIDDDLGAWVWIDRIETSGLTAEGLHERLNLAVKAVLFWRRQLGTIGKAEGPQGDQPTPAGDFDFIRI